MLWMKTEGMPPAVAAAHWVESYGARLALDLIESTVQCLTRVRDRAPSELSEVEAVFAKHLRSDDIPSAVSHYQAIIDAIKAMNTEQATQGVPQ